MFQVVIKYGVGIADASESTMHEAYSVARARMEIAKPPFAAGSAKVNWDELFAQAHASMAYRPGTEAIGIWDSAHKLAYFELRRVSE